MPSYARRYPKKRYVKKAKVPKVSKATKAYVKEALVDNKELNWALIDVSTQALGYDLPFLAQWSSIAQGGTTSQREGDRIEPVKLIMNFDMYFGGVAQAVSRVIIFQWKPDTAVDAPSLAKILSVTATNYAYLSPYVQTRVLRSKFKVLYDRTFDNQNSIANSSYTYQVELTKFSAKYITYNTGTTTGKNQIFIVGLSDQVVGSPNAPNFKKISFLNWKDTA